MAPGLPDLAVDRAQSLKRVVPSVPKKNNFFLQAIGMAESQKAFAKARKPYVRKYEREQHDVRTMYHKQERTINRFFSSNQEQQKMKKLRGQYGVSDQDIERNPGLAKQKMLRQLRSQRVRDLAKLKREHAKGLRELRRGFDKERGASQLKNLGA